MDFPAGKATTAEQVEAVKAYAKEKYEKGGWDIVVECWDEAQIIETIKGTGSRWGAVERVSKSLRAITDYRADIAGTAF